jgi:Ala-tRNA(Pro) deacylase
MSELFHRLTSLLHTHGIRYTILEHEPIKTAEEAVRVRGRPREETLRRATKSIVLRSEGRFFLFATPGDRKIDFKKVRALLNTESVSLATHEEVLRVAGVPIGSVPPFGTLFAQPIPTYGEKSMERNEEIDCSPGRHDASLTLRFEDWKKVVQPIMADFAQA